MPAAPEPGDWPPALSVVIPTFNNEPVLRRAVEGRRRFGGDRIELIVIEDGCRDATAAYLEEAAGTPWDRQHLRWVHEDDAHDHLGSTTIETPSEHYKAAVLRNGRLFYERWGPTIARTHARPRRTWRRRATAAGWTATVARIAHLGMARMGAAR